MCIYFVKEACFVLEQNCAYRSGAEFSCSLLIPLHWNRAKTSTAEIQNPLHAEAGHTHACSNVQHYLTLSKKRYLPRATARQT